MRLAGVLSVPGDTQPVEARLLNVTPLVLALLKVRQGTLQQWTNPLAGSRERSNSHELSMLHPTRLSLLTSGATPQAVQPPEMGKKRLERLKVHITVRFEVTVRIHATVSSRMLATNFLRMAGMCACPNSYCASRLTKLAKTLMNTPQSLQFCWCGMSLGDDTAQPVVSTCTQPPA
jgi:hypothetical protein